MQVIERQVPNAGYEQGDAIVNADDDHVWSVTELGGNFNIVTGVTLTQEETDKLLMEDTALTDPAVITRIPTFRSLATSNYNTKALHRRKYALDGATLKIKPNAQDRR